MNNWKLVVTILGFVYCLYYLATFTDWHFIDNINLLFHEAGHVLMWGFGELVMLLGGTIFQILIPLVLITYFYFKNQTFSASLIFYWLAINLFNISLYSGDALTRELPLITGDPDTHDWNQILFILGWFKYTATISWIFYISGIASMVFGLIWGIVASRKEKTLTL